jgi:hypothetical protein
MKDFTIHNDGSIFMVTPNTQFAKDWVTENISLEPWQWLGNSFSVEYHYIAELVQGMVNDGFSVE